MAATFPTRVEQYTIPETMRSAVLFGPRDIRVIDRPCRSPVLARYWCKWLCVGPAGAISRSTMGIFRSPCPLAPLRPGHEWTGTVVALGETVDEFAVGDRVCIEAHHGCGRCDNCLIGKYTACLHYGNAKKGHRATGMTADGGFAECAAPRQLSLQNAGAGVVQGRGADYHCWDGFVRSRRCRGLYCGV